MTRDEATDLVNELERSLSVPAQTCPLIDNAVSAVDAVQELCNRASRYESVEDFAAEVESELWSTLSQLEDIRKANDRLRELGREWHKLAEKIAVECPDYEEVPA